MLYHLVAPVSVVLTFDTRNNEVQLLEKMMTRFFTHAVEIRRRVGAVTRNAVERR